MAELADAPALRAGALRRGGASPSTRTSYRYVTERTWITESWRGATSRHGRLKSDFLEVQILSPGPLLHTDVSSNDYLIILQSTRVVRGSAVNRFAVGSNPTSGANCPREPVTAHEILDGL